MQLRSRFALAAVAVATLVGAPSVARAAPEEVKLGVYLKNIEIVDLQNNTYYLSSGFQNLVDTSSLSQLASFETPKQLEDGSKYQRWAVEGRFYHKFWLGTFPIDWQKITLEIEDAEHTASALVYVADEVDSKIDAELSVPGWRVGEVLGKVRSETYPTSFGLETQQPEARTFSHYRFGVRLDRPSSFMLLKVLPQIGLVLLCCLMMFFISPDHVDARVGTVVTALLTEVFLHLTFTSSLPAVGLLMLLDHIFNFAYLMTVLILLECVIVTYIFDKMVLEKEELEEIEDEAEKKKIKEQVKERWARINRYDRIAAKVFPILYLVGTVTILLVTRGPSDLIKML